jgi:hypothetical protein
MELGFVLGGICQKKDPLLRKLNKCYLPLSHPHRTFSSILLFYGIETIAFINFAS